MKKRSENNAPECLSDYLAHAVRLLKNSGIGNPRLDARLIIGHVLGLDNAQIYSQSQRIMTEEELRIIDGLLNQRLKGKPIARLFAQREFWSLPFQLNEATLDPRPDSETVVEAVLLARKNGLGHEGKKYRILDLGTGSGCLLLALLREMPNATGIGIDISSRAVEQAAQNAVLLDLAARAKFRVGDWLKRMKEKFDIIVSNPPYIPSAEIPKLMREVREHDPLLALDGGKDGLDPYRLLIPQLPDFLKPAGLVAFEVGIGQANAVAELLKKNGFSNIAIRKDLGLIERCVMGSL